MALPQQQQQQLQGRQRRRFRQTEWGRQSALDRKSVSGRFGAAWNRGRGATPKGKKERRGLILQCPRCSRAETLHLENSTNDIFGVRNTQKRREIDDYTMKLLDWVNICSHVSIFTSTKLGNEECYNMVIGSDIEESLRLQRETQSVFCLEAELGKRVEFRGVDSTLVQSALKRTENGGRLTPELFNSVRNLITCMNYVHSLVKSTFQSQNGVVQQRLEPLMDLVQDLSGNKHLAKEISKAVDEDNNVKDNASQSLSKLRNQIRILERKILAQVRTKGDLPTTHKGRVCLSIYVNELPKYEKNYLLIGNAESGGMVYVEPASVISMNNRLMELRNQESAEIETICWKLTALVEEKIFELKQFFHALVSLDVIVARARYTISVNGNWPQLVEPGRARSNEKFTVRLKQLRNPLLLWEQRKAKLVGVSRMGKEDAGKPVPVDIFVEKGVSAIIITGPNTGGKTASMKALGVVSLMSKAGLGIPASGSVIIPAFDNVYADIGDEQSLSNNLSTFSSHIKHIQGILDHCTDKSLVLLDELGTGTDPVEGSALGTAIVKSLLDRALLTIATTHFSHISSLKYVDSRVENAAVDFDPETLKPTYQIIWGASGKSNAFHIAKSLGLQEEILSTAMEIAGEAEAEAESGGSDLASTLEELRSGINDCSLRVKRNILQTRDMYESSFDALQSLRVDHLKLNQQKTPNIVSLLEESRVKMKEVTKANIKSQAKEKSEKTSSDSASSSKMQKLVTKVQRKESRKRQKKASNAKKKQQQVEQNLLFTKGASSGGGGAVNVGRKVYIPQLKANGIVLSVLGSEVLVQMGQVKMKVKIANVQLL